MNARQVLVIQLLAFLTFTIGTSAKAKSKSVVLPQPQQLMGWALLTFILLVGTDIDATAELATSFAWLIFVSVMLLYGVDLFNRLSEMVGGKGTAA